MLHHRPDFGRCQFSDKPTGQQFVLFLKVRAIGLSRSKGKWISRVDRREFQKVKQFGNCLVVVGRVIVVIKVVNRKIQMFCHLLCSIVPLYCVSMYSLVLVEDRRCEKHVVTRLRDSNLKKKSYVP